ncbi:MAG TPA: prolipoprotein diacylglyceryl transferase family protein [Roseiflexaceae bacterium]|nr:prolipoprotein diacylglyceryl transferase family protein [Roseiflexaceae bacterium]
MYPLIELGPLRLSSGGLLLLLSILVGQWLLVRAARARGNAPLAEQAERCFYPALLGAAIGARLWYGVFNWSLYSQTPSLFVALRVGEFAWPGALLGGALAGFLWCRWRRGDPLELADCAALALPPAQVLASVGLLLSGEAFGVPTSLPWGIPLFGATRHPTQLYFALAALLSFGVLQRVASRRPRRGTLTAAYLGLQGMTLLLVEALRSDSLLLPAGVRAGQVFGLALVLLALLWMRWRTRDTPKVDEIPHVTAIDRA